MMHNLSTTKRTFDFAQIVSVLLFGSVAINIVLLLMLAESMQTKTVNKAFYQAGAGVISVLSKPNLLAESKAGSGNTGAPTNSFSRAHAGLNSKVSTTHGFGKIGGGIKAIIKK